MGGIGVVVAMSGRLLKSRITKLFSDKLDEPGFWDGWDLLTVYPYWSHHKVEDENCSKVGPDCQEENLQAIQFTANSSG